MPIIDIKTAVAKIRQIVQQRKERARRSPFFFIVGAGISYPEIPLANAVEEHCRREAQKYGRNSSTPSGAAIDSYSHWMSEAFPSKEGRQVYLRNLMQDKPISKANLRLAHILLHRTVAHTVFTPNFDDMLTNALQLFGERPLLSDHPLTVDRMRIHPNDVQVIQVHGSYWHYDCCNLKGEIEGRSEDATMTLALYEYMRELSPIVVGYSGWEGDIIMSAIRQRLKTGPLQNPIFWFCFRRDSIDRLPGWLKNAPDILFVAPEVVERQRRSELRSQNTEATGPSPAPPGETEGALGEAKENTVSAVQVFDALITSFGLPAPQLTQDPLSFYAKHLRSQLGTDGEGEAELDTFYSFHAVIERVERAAKTDRKAAPDELQALRDAMSKADYRGVIQAASQIPLYSLAGSKLRTVTFVLIDACMGLYDDPADEMAGCDLVENAQRALAHVGLLDSALQGLIASVLYRKGAALEGLGRSEEAATAYGDFADRFDDSAVPGIQRLAAAALLNKGFTLGQLNRNEEAIAAYDDLLRRFVDAQDPEINENVVKALNNKAHALGELGKAEEGIAVYDELICRFAQIQESGIRERVAGAEVGKGFLLWKLGRYEESLTLHDDLLRRFADAPEAGIRKFVANALLRRAIVLGQLKGGEDEIAAYDDVVNRFSDSSEPEIRELVALALYNKGYWLWSIRRVEDAIAAWNEVERRFSDSTEAGVREWLLKAIYAKGITLERSNAIKEAIQTYEDVVRCFSDAPEKEIEQIMNAARSGIERLRGNNSRAE